MSFSPGSDSSFRVKSNGGLLTDQHSVRSNTYLEVLHHPPPPPRRSSHASGFSDISDLDYMSNEHNTGLLRTVSNISTYSTYSNAGPVTWREKLRNLYHQNYGAMLVLLSQVFGSGMNVAARLLEQPGAHGPPMHPFQILFTRQSLTALLCTIYAVTTKSIPHFPLGPPDPKVRLLLVCRGVFGFFGVFGMYFSLLYLPLSEATVMTFLAPILTCYICSLVLPGESFTRQQQIAGVVSFIGVVFIAQPFSFVSASTPASHGINGNVTPDTKPTVTSDPYSDHNPTQPTPSQHLLAIGIAMLGVCGATGAMTSIRAIGTRAHAFISINYFSVWSVIVSLIALIVVPGVSFRLPGNLIEWGLLLSLGICGFVLQALLTMGLAYGGPANNPNSKSTSTIVDNNDIERQPQPTVNPHPSSSSSSSASTHNPSQITRRKSLTTRNNPRPKQRQPHPSGNRATSMVYCQMLFALAADKLIFGTTMGVWSWIGSGLILGGAVCVATAGDGKSKSKSKSKAATSVGGNAINDRNDRSHRSRSKPNTTDKKPEEEEEEIGLLHDNDVDDGIDYDFDEDTDTTTDDDDEEEEGGDISGKTKRNNKTTHSIFSTSTLSSPSSSRRSASIALSPKSMVPVS